MLQKTYRMMNFNQKSLSKPGIDMYIGLSKAAKNDSEKIFSSWLII